MVFADVAIIHVRRSVILKQKIALMAMNPISLKPNLSIWGFSVRKEFAPLGSTCTLWKEHVIQKIAMVVSPVNMKKIKNKKIT